MNYGNTHVLATVLADAGFVAGNPMAVPYAEKFSDEEINKFLLEQGTQDTKGTLETGRLFEGTDLGYIRMYGCTFEADRMTALLGGDLNLDWRTAAALEPLENVWDHVVMIVNANRAQNLAMLGVSFPVWYTGTVGVRQSRIDTWDDAFHGDTGGKTIVVTKPGTAPAPKIAKAKADDHSADTPKAKTAAK